MNDERKKRHVNVNITKFATTKVTEKPAAAKSKKRKIKEGYKEPSESGALSREIVHEIIKALGQSRSRELYNKIMSGDQSMLDTFIGYILDFSDGKVTDYDVSNFIDSTLDAFDALT